MKSFGKLIHKSYMTFLPTHYPVHYYGLPDGYVYLCYARLYEEGFHKTDLEYVFARHNDFKYNYLNEVVIPKAEFRAPVYNEMVDNPDPDITIVETRRDITSYAQAIKYLKSINQSTVIIPKLKRTKQTHDNIQLGA
ncbi:hypothetical protein [uncultured Draconibacterium sp.]|uniref:hypothetical protein n=1 Tax=uncultured Draconibacterium sp. TaxID=1573823 RepID=UPI0025E6C9CE|nr:hypothetical protein [uncultured Draconibacterium sp.]